MTPKCGTWWPTVTGGATRTFRALGRLLYLQTDHGKIDFPAHDGEYIGPDWRFSTDGEVLPISLDSIRNVGYLLVLGQWEGFPALRKQTTQPCSKCRHACDICDGSGKKQCEGFQCGGRGWVPDLTHLLSCSAAGCLAETGKAKLDCTLCGGAGQIYEQKTCPMCLGTKLMTCARCSGTGKFSTGKINGAVDWNLPACKACDGTGLRGEMVRQDVAKFTNATLLIPKSVTHGRRKAFRVIGPIREFALMDFRSQRTRVFEVYPDAANDLLVLLVPRSPMQRPQKAYLVGGIVREVPRLNSTEMRAGVTA